MYEQIAIDVKENGWFFLYGETTRNSKGTLMENALKISLPISEK